MTTPTTRTRRPRTGRTLLSTLAIVIAAERGWIARQEAIDRLLRSVRFLWKADSYHGVFPHFLHGGTGRTIPFTRKDDGGDGDAGTGGRGTGRQRLLDILLKESQRLDRTIKGFLRFARPRERSVEQFDIAALVEENCELLRNSPELSEHPRLDVHLDPPSVHIHADPDQVTQIFWNLVRNALRAMEDIEGGRLEVSGRTENGWYVFEAADTRRGMSEEARANLFHPFQSFFDTGTGIGMAIVYRIVEEHEGHVSVSSRSGGGTRITVKLPLAGVVKEEPTAVATEGRSA